MKNSKKNTLLPGAQEYWELGLYLESDCEGDREYKWKAMPAVVCLGDNAAIAVFLLQLHANMQQQCPPRGLLREQTVEQVVN